MFSYHASDITFSMPLKKTGQEQNEASLLKDDTSKVDEPDLDDDEDDDDDWINDIDIHSNLRSKL